MPHWTVPRPAPDDPIAGAATAITTLQTHLDTLFDGNATAAAIDDVSGHVRTFSQEFEQNAAEARAKLSSA
jgi:hypothetical protein